MVSRVALCGFALSVLGGCTMTANVKPSELARLDGYDVQNAANTEPVLERSKGTA